MTGKNSQSFHFCSKFFLQSVRAGSLYFNKNLYGKANATYVSPDFVPIFPPPQAMTTYCFPFTE